MNNYIKQICMFLVGFLEAYRGPLKPQMSITELLNSSRLEQQHLLGADESTGLQEHTEQNCLYCSAITVLGSHAHSRLNNTHTRTGDQTHASREFQLHKTSVSFKFLRTGCFLKEITDYEEAWETVSVSKWSRLIWL